MLAATESGRQLISPWSNPRKVFRTICSGNYRLPENKKGKFIHREQPLQQLVRILKCEDGSKSFFVVTGPKSVGKSSLAQVACSGLQGTICLELEGTADTAEDAKEAFVVGLAHAIGYSLPQGKAAEHWHPVNRCLEEAATRFRRERGRPAVLVIDGVEFLKENEKFMVSLVGYAKTWADNDDIRVVFITSAGRFVDVVEATDKNTRGKLVYVNGMDPGEAVQLLKAKGLWMDDRSASLQRVADLAGDRFSWLLDLGDKVAKANSDMGVSGVEAEVMQECTRPFLQANLTDGSQDSSEYMVAVPALKKLAALGSIKLLDFLKLLSMNRELLNTLVKCDIVSTAAGIVRFQSSAAKWYAESLPAASSQGRRRTTKI